MYVMCVHPYASCSMLECLPPSLCVSPEELPILVYVGTAQHFALEDKLPVAAVSTLWYIYLAKERKEQHAQHSCKLACGTSGAYVHAYLSQCAMF